MSGDKGSDTESTLLLHDEVQSILDHQITVYTHLRNQSQRLIRILLAASAILIAIASSDIIKLIDISSLPRYHSQVASNLSVEVGFIEFTSQANSFVGALFLLIGIVLVLDSFLWASRILQMSGLEPLMGENSQIDVSVVAYGLGKDLENSDLGDNVDKVAERWLENNNNLLNAAKNRLQLTYERLGAGITFLLFGGIVLVVAQMGRGQILALLNATYVIALGSLICWETWKGWKWYVQRSRSKFQSSLLEDAEKTIWNRISGWPHPLLWPFLFMPIVYGFVFSLIVSLAWFFEVVLPALRSFT